MESSHFWPSLLHDPLYKTLFFNFWFRPLTHKIYSQKFGIKSPISRFVWQIDQRCFGLLGGFGGWLIQWNHTKCCGLTLVAMATTFVLGAESSRLPICYLSVCYTCMLCQNWWRHYQTFSLPSSCIISVLLYQMPWQSSKGLPAMRHQLLKWCEKYVIF